MEIISPGNIQLTVSEFLRHSEKYEFQILVTDYSLYIVKEGKGRLKEASSEHFKKLLTAFKAEEEEDLPVHFEHKNTDSNLQSYDAEGKGSETVNDIENEEWQIIAQTSETKHKSTNDKIQTINLSGDAASGDPGFDSIISESHHQTEDDSIRFSSDDKQIVSKRYGKRARRAPIEVAPLTISVRKPLRRNTRKTRKKPYGSKSKIRGKKVSMQKLGAQDSGMDVCTVTEEDDYITESPDSSRQFGPCEICGKSFASQFYLDVHKATHMLDNGENDSQANIEGKMCNVCGLTFDSLLALKTHMSTGECVSNDAEQVIKCTGCSSEFFSRQRFALHKCEHFKYICKVCGRNCQTKRWLLCHMITHGKDMPYQCAFCPAKFQNKSHLMRHKEIHAIFSCELCGLPCSSSAALRSHILSHNDQSSSFKCRFCDATFNQIQNLGKHLVLSQSGVCAEEVDQGKWKRKAKKRTDYTECVIVEDESKVDSPFKCGICQRPCASIIGMKQHVRKTHKQTMPFHCTYCGKGFTSNEDRNDHETTHDVDLNCGICAMRFTSSNALLRHVKQHPQDKHWHCIYCGVGFDWAKDLEAHVATHDVDKFRLKKYVCGVCGKQYVRKEWMDEHLKQHPPTMPYHCSTCGKGFTSKEVMNDHELRHIRSAKQQPFECGVCGKSYSRRSRLRKHIKVHPPTMPYHCKWCGRGFDSEEGHTTHESEHKLEKPYQCDICYKDFSCNWDLRTHTIYHHNNPQAHQCPKCLKCFRTGTQLRMHKICDGSMRGMQHNKSTPKNQLCDLCGKYLWMSTLPKHMEDHLKGGRQCTYCGKWFLNYVSLWSHTKVHHIEKGTFLCDSCGKNFTTKRGLLQHNCNKSKDFSCHICGKRMTLLRSLTRHMKIHAGVRDFACHICGKAFFRQCELKYHMKSHKKKMQQNQIDTPPVKTYASDMHPVKTHAMDTHHVKTYASNSNNTHPVKTYPSNMQQHQIEQLPMNYASNIQLNQYEPQPHERFMYRDAIPIHSDYQRFLPEYGFPPFQ